MDWFYYAYGDTLHGLVPRIYRHSKGNVSLSTSILPIDLILQVVLLPIYLLLFAGSIETIPLPTLIESILIVLIFPFVLAHLTRFLLRRKRTSFKQYRHTLFQQCSDFLSIICDYGNVCFPRLILA